MDARELRIANWVKEIRTGKYRQVLMIGWDTIYTGLSNDYPDDYEPIPLTPEILEKCGFACHHEYDGNYWRREDYKPFQLEYVEFAIEGENGFYFDSDMCHEFHVEHLHQLQNLYFALTQTDLPINL